MSVYGYNIEALGTQVEKGLADIAKAIEKTASKPTYIVNVIVTDGDRADIGAKVDEALKRVQKRESSIT